MFLLRLKCFVKSFRTFRIVPETCDALVRYCDLGKFKNEKYVDKAKTCRTMKIKNTRKRLKKAIRLRMYKDKKVPTIIERDFQINL